MGAGVALPVCIGAVAVVTVLGSAAAAVQAPPTAEESPVKARTHLVVGELVRLDPRRRVMVVKTAERPAREIEIAVEPSTRITAQGRAVALLGIRPGSRLSVTCVDTGGLHAARLVAVRAGTTPAASPPASPRP